jgi:outer membrane protein
MPMKRKSSNKNMWHSRGLRALLILLAIWLGAVSAVQAQRALSLDEAIQIALRKRLEIELLRNDAAAAQLLNHYGVAGGLPTVTATANDQAQITNLYQKLATGTEIARNGAMGNNLTASIAGTMVLYNGMRIAATKDRLDQLAQQSQQFLAAEIQNTVADVMLQYYDARRQESFLSTLDSSIAVASKSLEITKARQSAGFANNADVFQAQLDLSALQQERLNQELVIAQAKADLLDLLNEDVRQEIHLPDSFAVNEGLNWDSLVAGSRLHPQVLAAEHQVQVQQLLEREIAAQRLPTLRANAGLNFGNNVSTAGFNLVTRTYGPYAGLNLSIPIYNGGSLKRQGQVAALDTRNAEINKEILIQDQEAALWQSWLTYQNALLLLKNERENVTLSGRLLDLMVQRYSLRQATILELKEAQQSFEESRFRLVNLEFAAKAAEVELRRRGGRLP